MNKKVISIIILSMLFLTPSLSFAQFGGPSNQNPPSSGPANSNTGSCGGKLCNPISAGSIPALVAAILNIVVAVGAPIIVFFVIYSGFLFVTARGNVSQLERSKHAIMYTLIGGLIVLGAFLISEVICSTVEGIAGRNICQ